MVRDSQFVIRSDAVMFRFSPFLLWTILFLDVQFLNVRVCSVSCFLLADFLYTTDLRVLVLNECVPQLTLISHVTHRCHTL